MRNLSNEDIDTLEKAAVLLCAGHSTGSSATFAAEMIQVAIQTASTGGTGTKAWAASLKALGKIIVTIAEREEAKNKAMRL